MNLINIYKNGDTKEIKFCGLTIYKRIVCDIYKKSYFCGINVLNRNILKGFYKKHRKSFKDYTTIYLLNSNIGESFLVFKYFANHLHSDSALFVATKKFHVEIINMLLPKCNYILQPINPDGYPDTFEVDKKTFRVLFNHQYYITLEKDIKNKESLAPPPPHYFQRMFEYFSFDSLSINDIHISPEATRSLDQKMMDLSLNQDKFVFVSPQANTCSDIDVSTCARLQDMLTKLGYDVFWNVSNQYLALNNIKSCFLSLQEAFVLVKKAKYFIALRSGFAELLVWSQTPSCIIYTAFKHRNNENYIRSAKLCLEGFTLTKTPSCNVDLKEFVVETKEDYDEIFVEIKEDLCR